MKILAVCLLLCVVMTQAGALLKYRCYSPLLSSCPHHWTKIRGRCFRFFPTPMTWAKAEKTCNSLKANLASVHGIDEYHEIQRLITASTHKFDETWLGGSDAQEERSWFWSDGSSFQYTNWCPGEPNNLRGRQHCLQMNFGAGKCWDDVGCTENRPFICVHKNRPFGCFKRNCWTRRGMTKTQSQSMLS